MDQERDRAVKDSDKNLTVNPGYFDFVVLKVEKLTTATYMVTNFLPDADPVKWKLRGAVLELMSELSGNAGGSVFYKTSVLNKSLSKIKEIGSLLDVALASGSVSEMNLAILKREYLNLGQVIDRRAGSKAIESYLASAGDVRELPSRGPAPTDNADRQPVKPFVAEPKAERPTPEMPEDSRLAPAPQPEAPKAAAAPSNEEGMVKNNRQSVILEFVDGKGWTSIKDIADVVPGCSRKTVQRELADLVERGILKKRGDRRWSRYILAK